MRGDWVARNAQRFYVVLGFVAVAMSLLTATPTTIPLAALIGAFGCQLLGGWPALRRLVTHPLEQLRHWYYILIDARQFKHVHWPDGSVEVVRMRPTRQAGWHWMEERPWERGES